MFSSCGVCASAGTTLEIYNSREKKKLIALKITNRNSNLDELICDNLHG